MIYVLVMDLGPARLAERMLFTSPEEAKEYSRRYLREYAFTPLELGDLKPEDILVPLVPRRPHGKGIDRNK